MLEQKGTPAPQEMEAEPEGGILRKVGPQTQRTPSRREWVMQELRAGMGERWAEETFSFRTLKTKDFDISWI